MGRVYIGLGANLGDPETAIKEALQKIERHKAGQVISSSSLYRTEPVGVKDQPWFVNAAAEIRTALAPADFRKALAKIETEMGRPEDRLKDGPRVIDLDVLLWDEHIIKEGDLEVPHPRLHQRKFVLEPLAEIAPCARHPRLEKTIKELLQALRDNTVVEKIEQK